MAKRTGVLAGVIGATLVGLAVAAPASAQTVKVGVILTYSGADSQPSDEIDKAITLYLKQHTKELPPGVKIELIKRDDTGPKPEVAKRLTDAALKWRKSVP